MLVRHSIRIQLELLIFIQPPPRLSINQNLYTVYQIRSMRLVLEQWGVLLIVLGVKVALKRCLGAELRVIITFLI